MALVEPLASQTAITAVKFIGKQQIAVGVGSFIKIYDYFSPELKLSRKIFDLNKIHGIKCVEAAEPQLLVWGGNEYALVSLENLEIIESRVFKDRLVDVDHHCGTFYALTAHNEVIAWGKIESRYMSTERSILYSGSLFISNEKKLVACGTVFNGVIVWDILTQKVIEKFKSHEGSIFDVSWNDDGTEIATCSDDRSIILSSLITGSTIAIGWGHVSRVWQLKFINNSQIISAAEDCTVRLWQLSRANAELKCIKIFTGHSGKSVWAVDFDGEVAASGGGDGRMMLWDLRVQDSITTWGVNTHTGDSGVRSCAILDSSEENVNLMVAVTTNKGQVALFNGSEWSLLGPSLGSVATVKSRGNLFYALASNGNGLVYNANRDQFHTFSLGMHVLDFFLMKTEILIVPVPPSSDLRTVRVDESGRAELVNVLSLPAKFAQPTCVLSVGAGICIGSRRGDVLYYPTTSGSEVAPVLKIHALGKDAVTSLMIIDSDDNEENTRLIQATSRSSEYGVFELNTLKVVFKSRARKRGSIEGQSQNIQGTIMWGFQNDTFLAWNAFLTYEFLAIKCGGSHRSWDFRVQSGSSTFVYVRAGEIFIHRLSTPSDKFRNPSIQPGSHGREIRGMESCPANPLVVVTVSEDTTVNVGIIDGYNTLKPKVTITDGHVSGIQALHWRPDGKYFFTGAGKGELVMWELYQRNSHIFVNEKSRMPVRNSQLRELRVMDFAFHEDLVAVAYSDSSFRIWRVHETSMRWELLLQEKYKECCLLNINLVYVGTSHYILISSTDGNLVGYHVDETVWKSTQKCIYQLHKSSIRRSAVLELDGNVLYHYSGGDDNALRGVKLTFGDDHEISIQEIFSIRDAHSAAVTSVVAKNNCLISTGSDQRITVWALDGRKLTVARTNVSDTECLIAQDGHIISAGIGIEFFEYAT